MKAWLTYDVVTEESAAEGDCAEHGYAAPGGWRFPLEETGEAAAQAGRDNVLDSRAAIRWMLDQGAVEASSSRGGPGDWWSTIDREPDYRTGEDIGYSLHLDEKITPSSWRRVDRLLKGLPVIGGAS